MSLCRLWQISFLWFAYSLSAQSLPNQPYNFNQEPVKQDVRQALEFLGYRFDNNTGNIFSPDKSPLARSQYLALLQPFNIKEAAVDDRCRTQLIVSGYRVNDEDGTVLSLETKKAITKIEWELQVKACQLGYKHIILERIRHLLLTQDPNKPLSPDAAAQIKQIAETDKNALSPAFSKMLEGGRGLPASALLGEAERSYTESVRFWDGQVSIFKQAGIVLPVSGEWNGPKKVPVYLDDNERKLGDALVGEIATYLGKNPIGAEVVNHFKINGKTDLPKIVILNIDKKMGAFYNSTSKALVINQQYILDSIIQGVPEKDRKALLARLSNSKNLVDYLLANPQARTNFMAAHDVEIVHELTHAWQDRREKLMLEMNRNNIPAFDELEYEHEAFLTQNRYLHQQLMTSPALVKDKPWLSDYIQLLGGFQQWRDAITERYVRDWPEAAATIPTAKSIQQERIGLARRMMGEDFYQHVRQWLKIQGFDRGTLEMQQAKTGYDKRMASFLKNEYPEMQYAGYGKLAELFASQDRLDQVFYAQQRRLIAAKNFNDEQGDLKRAADRAVIWMTAPNRKLSLDDSLGLVTSLNNYYHDQKKSPPTALRDITAPTYRQGAEKYLAMARAEKDFVRRAHELEWSEEAYAKAIGDTKLLEQIRSMRQDKIKVP